MLNKTRETEQSSQDALPRQQVENNQIVCIEYGGNSSDSKCDDYEDESTSNRVQVVFIGSNEPVNTSSSIKEEQYESDLLEEEKVAADGKLIYYKGK